MLIDKVVLATESEAKKAVQKPVARDVSGRVGKTRGPLDRQAVRNKRLRQAVGARHFRQLRSQTRAESARTLLNEQSFATYSVGEHHALGERSILASVLDQTGFVSDMAMVNLIRNRLPLSVIDRLLLLGVTKQEINLVAPARTLAHRRANDEPLTIEESDRALRLARVVAQTEVVFGNREKAMGWLRRPMKRFEGKAPIEMLTTDVGSRLVEEALTQIDEGFYA